MKNKNMKLTIVLFLVQYCSSERRQTLITPFAGLQDLFSLFQTFPQGGSLASSDTLDRVQCQISNSYTFPCAFTRGSNYYIRPTLVSDVGPADIDVVAAIGDYLVAGTAALANNTGDTFKDFPEVSFAMGGSGDWRSVTTIPNLLKQFNPNIIGFSAGDFNEKGLNFGRSDATSKDLEEQAMDLVSAIESDERIDMNTYWKLVIVSSGSVDLCRNSCSSSQTLSQFGKNVRRALDVLMQLPNILIAVVSPPDPSTIQSALHRPVTCQVLTRSLCPCVTSNTAKPRSEFLSDLSQVRASLQSVVSSMTYQDRMNAGVIFLTGLHDLELPADEGLNLQVPGLPPVSFLPDLSYLAPNCFHPSQKLHSKIAKILWNNMFQSQSKYVSKDEGLWCPSRQNPNFLGKQSGTRYKRLRLKRSAYASNHCNL